jgi:hypothetical protein
MNVERVDVVSCLLFLHRADTPCLFIRNLIPWLFS